MTVLRPLIFMLVQLTFGRLCHAIFRFHPSCNVVRPVLELGIQEMTLFAEKALYRLDSMSTDTDARHLYRVLFGENDYRQWVRRKSTCNFMTC